MKLVCRILKSLQCFKFDLWYFKVSKFCVICIICVDSSRSVMLCGN